MNATARRNRILRILRSERSISTASLRDALGVSAETIRQDLIYLVSEGLAHRHHGLVTLAGEDEVRPELRRRGVLTADERRREVRTLIEQRTSVRTRELARIFGVSAATIRGDILHLQELGVVGRRHGEVLARPARRNAEHGNQSRRPVGTVAAHFTQLIHPGDFVYLDDSDVSVGMATQIPAGTATTVVTNSLRVADACRKRPDPLEVFILPGFVRSDCVTDVRFRSTIARSMRVSKAVVGLSSIACDNEVSVGNALDADVCPFVFKLADSVYFHVANQNDESGGSRVLLGRERSAVRQIVVDCAEAVGPIRRMLADSWPAAICGPERRSAVELRHTIGLAIMDGTRYFSRCIRDSLAAEAQADGTVEILTLDNEFDHDKTLANVDELIEAEVDLAVEFQHDYGLSGLIGERFADAGIPVIAVDIPIAGGVYFGIKNYHAGSIAGTESARIVSDRWQGEVDFVLIVGDTVAGPTSEARVRGMIEAFRRRISIPDDRILRIDPTNREESVRCSVETLLRSSAVPKEANRVLILTVNATATLGAVAAVRALGLVASTVIVGNNVTPQVDIELARSESPLCGCVAFHPEWYGRGIMDLAREILAGRVVEPSNHMEPSWVSRESAHLPQR